MKPIIAITMGDPAGIGPEIVARSVADKELFALTNCIVIGDRKVMANAIRYIPKFRKLSRTYNQAG